MTNPIPSASGAGNFLRSCCIFLLRLHTYTLNWEMCIAFIGHLHMLQGHAVSNDVGSWTVTSILGFL